MNSELQKRLYEIEVAPPPAVWEKLSVTIDEINADKSVANKILNTELTPPANVWEAINSDINKKKKTVVINLRRLAAAAIFIGIMITAWIFFRNNSRQSTETAGTENPAEIKKTDTGTNSVEKKIDENRVTDLPPSTSLAITTPQSASIKRKNKTFGARNYSATSSQAVTAQYAVLNNETPLGKNFDRPIDDLSLVTADQNYLTMVNSNGRLVKIPAQLASLAPHLQDKPISEDFYEVMFGEGTYWKETLNEWRKKIASSPVSSGDAFTSFIELLKTIQDK